ncbi:MAG: UDP-N-acetylmuramate dehydrogenase [Rhodanobacteraceae bacterium]
MSRDAGYSIVENASLTRRNTFRVAAQARRLIEVRDAGVLPELFDSAALDEGPLLVLGAGSNILFTRDWPGTVLSILADAVEILDQDNDRALVRVEAGANWNDFVHWSLAHGLAGLENLALIPGTVGAAPLQNIGAYGVELAEFVHTVHAVDCSTHAIVRLSRSECGFAYRDSLFKREPGHYVIGAVDFALSRQRALVLDYAGVSEELSAMGITQPTARGVADAVSRLRTRKLPNPAVVGNAGSFFKNPMVGVIEAQALHVDYPALPTWPVADGRAKLSAAWLIEYCGFKGLREGDAAVSDQHALVLINHGNASGAQIWSLAERIRAGVHSRFGIELTPEPRIV